MGIKEWFIKRAVKKGVKKFKKENPTMFNFLSGKKTYIVAVLTAVGGVLAAFGYVIPEYVWPILGALGLGAVRAGIKKTD